MKEKFGSKKVKISIIVVVALLVIWFLVVSPLIKFKNSEKQVMEAANCLVSSKSSSLFSSSLYKDSYFPCTLNSSSFKPLLSLIVVPTVLVAASIVFICTHIAMLKIIQTVPYN